VAPSYFFDGLEAGDAAPQLLDEEATKIASMLTRIKDDRLRGQIRSFITEIANSQTAEPRDNAA
jgi:hypothetical protein